MTIADELFEVIAHGRMDRMAEILDLEPALLLVRDSLGDTPLHVAVWNARVEIVKLLLTRKVDVNVRDGEGRTPLAGLLATMSACDHHAGDSPASRAFQEMKDLLVRSGGQV
ncbi:MAG: ankyrin repeat domain-containing protein [Candidatus Eisenbacteria bacterium]|nr:ankyrin repeat domain-containing protein [Candidatus Eisenbacteria bacterium]